MFKMSEKKYVIKPVEELPRRRMRRETVYDELVNDFLRSDVKLAEISIEGKTPKTIISGLRSRVKGKGVSVHLIAGKIFLEKTA